MEAVADAGALGGGGDMIVARMVRLALGSGEVRAWTIYRQAL